eukprot:5630294-Prymnesium_polylepis.1
MAASYSEPIGPGSRNEYMGSRSAVCLRRRICSDTGCIVLAAIAPDAAALGVPMPGKHESPQRSKPSTGVFRLGNGKGKRLESWPEKGADVPAAHARPYVPRSRRRKASCASGEPMIENSTRSRTSGMHRSTASHSTFARSSFFASYSGEPGLRSCHGSYGSPPDE